MAHHKDHIQPPEWPLKLFRWFCDPACAEDIEGDLIERFQQRTKNKKPAKWLLFADVVRLFRPGIIKTLEGTQKLNYLGMLKNYFITSIRFLKREKTFAFMNIAGLALGIGCALVIYKIVVNELSFDKHHDNYNRIYQVINEDITSEGTVYWQGQVHPLAQALRDEYPNLNATMIFYDRDGLIAVENETGDVMRFQEKDGVTFVEPQFLDLFTLNFLVGDAETALDRPGKVILTETIAKKYFGTERDQLHRVIGKSILLENKQMTYVSGVIEDMPLSTDFPFEIIFHYKDQAAANPWFRNGQDWEEYNSATNCFILLDEDYNAYELEKQLVAFVDKYLPEYAAETRTYLLQPLSELHFSDRIRGTYAGATITYEELTVFGFIGLFLIVTACINFINLSTAQAVKRSKEVGVRKTMGSGKKQLVIQFLCETFVITLIASSVGLMIATFLADQVERIFLFPIELDLFADTSTLIFLGILMVAVTIFSGIYPSLVLARMNPILAVKNSLNVKQTSGFFSLRRGLVVFQFAISQTLIIAIIILYKQMNYLQTKDLGFDGDSIVVVKLPEKDSINYDVLRNDLMANSAIENVSFSSSGPMANWNSTNPIFHPSIEGEDHWGSLKTVDENYFELYELELIAGEPFKASDPQDHAVVNRKLTKLLGFQDPIDALGERVKYGRGSLEFTIVGVVEDFHSSSLRIEMMNVLLVNVSWNIFQAGIKFKTSENSYAAAKGILEHIEKHWTQLYPEHVFDAQFYDQQLASMYDLEKSLNQIVQLFVFIAIAIGSLGLYGLVAFMANQKTKEIGIRKVMGASVSAIWNIFSKELLILLLAAFVIAGPVAYLIMTAWLNDYAYRVDIGPFVFIVAILASIVVALLTIGHKSLKVARANPILSLRDE